MGGAIRSTVALVAAVALWDVPGTASADPPAFDRPGISFSTSTIPRGTFALELGTPDFLHSSDQGTDSTLYSLDTNLRFGLGASFEMQLAVPVLNHQDERSSGKSDSKTGLGDSSLSLKATLPSRSDAFTWSALAGVSLATGADAFTAGHTQYRLASAVALQLSDHYSSGFYVNANYIDGRTGYTLSPNVNWASGGRLGAYVEAGYTHLPRVPDTTIAGAGGTWMLTPTVQLDVSMDFGLTPRSPAYQGGLGVSMFFE